MSRTETTLSGTELDLLDAYWRAANYLSVGQIYLLDNPLLREPLRAEHVKPRLLGHFGTTPGLNFIYAHLNRAIKRARPVGDLHHRPRPRRPRPRRQRLPRGHLRRDLPAHRRRRGRTARAVPPVLVPRRHPVARRTGDARARSTRAASSATRSRTRSALRSTTPTSLVACVVGDGEAETGPLATSWHSNKFLNPATDGAVLPVLHLNGYKIANPTVLARIPERELVALVRRLRLASADRQQRARRAARGGPQALRRRTRRSARRHPRLPGRCAQRRRDRPAALADARPAHAERLDWPARGRRRPGRRHLARTSGAGRRRARARRSPRILEEWMRSYRPDELFDEEGRLRAELRALAPEGERRMSANPHANGGALLEDLAYRTSATTQSRSSNPGRRRPRRRASLGKFLRDIIVANPRTFRLFGPDETASNRLGDVFAVTGPRLGRRTRTDRRTPRSRRARDGGALRAPVPGLARGVPADRPPRPVQLLRGLHPHRRLDVQPAREVAEGDARHPVAAPDRLAQLPAQLARLAAGPQRLLAPGPRLHRPRRQQEGRGHSRLPAARREHACCRSPTTACARATTST